MTFSDFLSMQVELCDALAPHTRILLATARVTLKR